MLNVEKEVKLVRRWRIVCEQHKQHQIFCFYLFDSCRKVIGHLPSTYEYNKLNENP